MFDLINEETRNKINSCFKSESFRYTALNKELLSEGEYERLRELQMKIERFLWTHPQYQEYLRDIDYLLDGGLAEREEEHYSFYKEKQLSSTLRYMRNLKVSFIF